MAEKIYKVFVGRPKAEWMRLSEEEQQAILKKMGTNFGTTGGKQILACDSSWANEQWAFWGVNEYPNLEALKKHMALLAEQNWPYEFMETMSILGTEMK